jgi:hypothetical protein
LELNSDGKPALAEGSSCEASGMAGCRISMKESVRKPIQGRTGGTQSTLNQFDADKAFSDARTIRREPNATSYIEEKSTDIAIIKSFLTALCEQEYGSACLEKFRQNSL